MSRIECKWEKPFVLPHYASLAFDSAHAKYGVWTGPKYLQFKVDALHPNESFFLAQMLIKVRQVILFLCNSMKQEVWNFQLVTQWRNSL